MTNSVRFSASLAGLAAVSLALTACSSSTADSEQGSDGAATVLVANARPTLALVGEGSEASLQEDPETARESVEVPFQPTAVVTFDIATLDTLDAIGAGDAVIGIPDVPLPEYLAEYEDLPTVGTLFEPDFEAVSELEPDLVVTAARSTGQYDELSQIATTIDLTAASGGAFDPAAGIARAEQLGEIFGAEDEVAARVAELDELAATIRSEVSGTALLLSVTGGEFAAFGEGSRFGYVFDDLGFTPAVAAAELPGAEGSPHGDTVTNEFILTADPDWIFAFDRGAATGEGASATEALDNALVARTTAAQEGHVVLLPASELYVVTNGLTAIGNVLTTLHDAVTA